MTPKPERTPGTWKWHPNYGHAGPLKGAFIDTDRSNIAQVVSIGCAADGSSSQEQCEANAAFIVLACNAHDELVAALRDLLVITKSYRDSLKWTETQVEREARAVLAKVEGK